MRKLALLATAAAATLGLAASAVAGPPTHVTIEDDAMFQSGGLTAACGFPVWVTIQGTVHITLRTDRDGVLHETDAFGDWSITFSAPSNGTEASYKFGPGFYVYPDGTDVGDRSIVTILGVDSNYPGAPAEAGRTVVVGEVIDVLPGGVPIVDLTGPTLFEQGNQLDGPASRENLCAALAG